jgi:hypothetical protein
MVGVPGNPEGMLVLARALAATGEAIAGAARSLESHVGALAFEGPAADRLRAETQQRRAAIETLASDLLQLAGILGTEAGVVADQIRQQQAAASQ